MREITKMGLWGKWRAMVVLGVITVVIVIVIFLESELPRDRSESTPGIPPSQATVE